MIQIVSAHTKANYQYARNIFVQVQYMELDL
jgi:hypothetical protein